VTIFGASFSRQGLWVILITIVILIALYFINNRTLFGKKMTAVATQPLAAGFVGISRGTMIRWSFIISATVGALSGIGLASIVPINYASGSGFMLKGFVGAVLGGWGKTTGAVVGGFLLGIIEAFSAAIMPSGYKDAVAFVILLIVLYFKPSGILGSSLVEAE
jgi:branched-chain amino acid transport system permease protein